MQTNRIYLHVTYDDKDAAKAAGARWDSAAKRWYVDDSETKLRVEEAVSAAAELRARAEAAEAAVRAARAAALRIAQATAALTQQRADAALVRRLAPSDGASVALTQAVSLYALRRRQGFLHAGDERELWRIASAHAELFEAFALPTGTRNRTDARRLPDAIRNAERALVAIGAVMQE